LLRESVSMMACAVVVALPAARHARAQTEPDLRSTYTVVGDGIPKPLSDERPNVENGRRIVTERQQGLCVLCHSGPFPEVRFQGDLATNLAGTGSRWSEAQLRLRLVDASRLNPQTIMPSYYRTEGLERVGWQWRGQPVLNAQQIEDVVAFLRTLRDTP
jgi:sulfur-oxidizing protein SoxX